jgi:hypothetical protein
LGPRLGRCAVPQSRSRVVGAAMGSIIADADLRACLNCLDMKLRPSYAK